MPKYLISRLKEGSTWRGLIMLLTAAGIWKLNPDQTEAIIAAGIALSGVIGVFWPERKPVVTVETQTESQR